MKKPFVFCIILSLFIINIISIDPPVWPQKFSISMMVNFHDLTTSAKLWYDSTANAQRFDFQNGNSRGGCGSIHPGDTPCNYLYNGGWLYFVYPEKNLCCKLVQEPIIPRNWLQNFTFAGQVKINDETFDVWSQNLGNNDDTVYYSDKSKKKIPRRQYQGQLLYLDYWTNSYSEKQFSLSIFDIPSYCVKMCSQRFENKIQYQKLVNNVIRMTSKRRMSNQQFRVLGQLKEQ